MIAAALRFLVHQTDPPSACRKQLDAERREAMLELRLNLANQRRARLRRGA